MKERMRRIELRYLSLFFLVLGITFTFLSEGRAEPKPSLAILPFFIERGEDPGRGSVCPVCKGVYQKGEISGSASVILNRLLYPKMETLKVFDLFPSERVEPFLSSGRKREIGLKPLPSLVQLGTEMKVDFLLAGFIFRFEERIGSSLGVEKPASVGFDLHLFRMRDGKMVWEAKFDETQKPLSEDILRIGAFFRRGATWLTAEELAGAGMDEMLRRFPGLKELEK
jgi:hypothetical protein